MKLIKLLPLLLFTIVLTTSVVSADEDPYGLKEVPLTPEVLASVAAKIAATSLVQVSNCMPPGPPNFFGTGGKDGTFCQATAGLPAGQFVSGFCQGGYCKAGTFTSGGGALQMFTNSLIQSATQSITQQLLGGLFGGGYGGDYPTPDDYEFEGNFLDFGTTTPSGDLDFNFVFDDTSTDLDYTPNTVTETFVFNPNDYGRPNVAVVNVPNSVPGDNLNGYVTPITGMTQFEIDLSSSSFNTDSYPSTQGGISLADLERDAAEARAREALLNERNGISSDLLDYRSSNVGGYNPLSGGEYQEDEVEKTWWQKILAAFGL
ncbi:hypothetical protein COB52_00675 [Candidatus Kaiserbacteria bacterium]|nr:MAG: hypothetical protein COB52_00675 [Candidatus Kaiserbacteria bacterium]